MTRTAVALITFLLGSAQSAGLPERPGGADWRHFVAGGLSAAISHGYTTPIDVVKTRMQTNPELYNGSLTTALSTIVKDDGAMFLLSGLGPTLAGYGVEGACKFGCYELCKPLFAKLTPSTFVNYLLASVLAGGAASLVLCPAEDVRIRLVADPTYAQGAVDGLRRLARENGPLASFKGFSAMLSKQVPYTAGKQVSFDVFCKLAHMLIGVLSGKEMLSEASCIALKSIVPILTAFPAAVLACVLSHPGDMVLTMFYKGGADNAVATLRKLLREGGLAKLFTGIQARLIHVIGILWVQLVIYDKLKVMLGLPATGH